MSDPPLMVRAGQVWWVLLRLGAVAFGGLGPALALLDRELVGRRGWLEPQRHLAQIGRVRALLPSAHSELVAKRGAKRRPVSPTSRCA